MIGTTNQHALFCHNTKARAQKDTLKVNACTTGVDRKAGIVCQERFINLLERLFYNQQLFKYAAEKKEKKIIYQRWNTTRPHPDKKCIVIAK